MGGATYTTITDPDGHERRCESYVLGSQTITRCDRDFSPISPPGGVAPVCTSSIRMMQIKD
jgi:hypothetical protein